MYFTAPVYTKDELNAEYKKLCKKLHPDMKGGSEAAFKAMKSQYDKINSEMVHDRWVRPNPFGDKVYYKKRPQSAHPQQQTEITPEDIQAGLEIFIEILNLFNGKKRK